MAEHAQVLDFQQARARRQARAGEARVDKATVARHLGCSKRTVTRYMAQGLPFVKRFEHSHPKFLISAVDEWYGEQR